MHTQGKASEGHANTHGAPEGAFRVACARGSDCTTPYPQDARQYNNAVAPIVRPDDSLQLDILVLVHHSRDTHLHYLLPSEPGLAAEFFSGDTHIARTDETWKSHELPMWRQDVPQRGWAIDWCEEYDARLEPPGWHEALIPREVTDTWADAVCVNDNHTSCEQCQHRPVPLLQRHLREPLTCKAWRAHQATCENIGELSNLHDTEPLELVADWHEYSIDHANELLSSGQANAFTFDLGKEYVGFYELDCSAPSGCVIEVSGAELLREGRPWIFRKNTNYSYRYHAGRAGTGPSEAHAQTPGIASEGRANSHDAPGGAFRVACDRGSDRHGRSMYAVADRRRLTCPSPRIHAATLPRGSDRHARQTVRPFYYSGFRYIHVVLRSHAEQIRLHHVGCRARRVDMTCKVTPELDNLRLADIFDMCSHTLQVGVQEHLIDCPTREQSQYWGDAVFVAQSLWRGFDQPSYLKWYLECFLHVPIRQDGQISSVYPGNHAAFADYSLIPMIGQQMHYHNTGEYYKPTETLAKAQHLRQWYERHKNSDGLVEFDHEYYMQQPLRVHLFIDHPGLGYHNFPHRGIDRTGASCGLNTFYYIYLDIMARMAEQIGSTDAAELRTSADQLGASIQRLFFDGTVYHDALHDGQLSEGTSWQTNSLVVYAGLADTTRGGQIMQAMLDGYDHLCRCSPYFHFYFLPALRRVGLERQARELIVREWGVMLDADATTTWEGFLGDEKDTYCHPWSTAPFLYLLDE